MPIQTSAGTATAGIFTQNEVKYMKTIWKMRTYDQFAAPIEKTFEPKGVTVQRTWLAKLQPRPTAALGSETADFDPQTVRDYSSTLSKVYLNDGLKAHDLLILKNSLGIEKELPRLVGELAAETIDALARQAATQGNLVTYGGSTTATARSGMGAGTAGYRMSVDVFTRVRGYLGSWMQDDNLLAVMDNWAYADLLNTSSSVITNRMQYADNSGGILFNYELGTLAGIRIVVSPLAKAFYGAGNANASVVNTTLATSTTANKAGSTTVEVAANTNIVAGMWLTLGNVQTSTESDATIITEIVLVASVSATTITVVGSGAGGTLKYDHAVGDTVKNPDTIHCTIFGSSDSMAVAFDGFGRYGKLVEPFQDGKAKQWTNWAFKYYGQYKLFDQSKIYRSENSASQQ